MIARNIIRKIFRLTRFTNQWPTRISIATRRSAIETNTKSIVVWQSIPSIWATIGCDWNIIELYKFRSIRMAIKLLKNRAHFKAQERHPVRNLTICIGFHKSGSIFDLWWYLNPSESSNETNFVLSQRCSRSMHIRWRNILFISFISFALLLTASLSSSNSFILLSTASLVVDALVTASIVDVLASVGKATASI